MARGSLPVQDIAIPLDFVGLGKITDLDNVHSLLVHCVEHLQSLVEAAFPALWCNCCIAAGVALGTRIVIKAAAFCCTDNPSGGYSLRLRRA